jgi:hypothetical protein
MHLLKAVMQFTQDRTDLHDSKKFAENFMKEWELHANNMNTEIDISSYDRSHSAVYDIDKLGKMAGPVMTLARHLNTFFASPLLMKQLELVRKSGTVPTKVIKSNDGKEKISIGKVAKRNYDDIISEGRNC